MFTDPLRGATSLRPHGRGEAKRLGVRGRGGGAKGVKDSARVYQQQQDEIVDKIMNNNKHSKLVNQYFVRFHRSYFGPHVFHHPVLSRAV